MFFRYFYFRSYMRYCPHCKMHYEGKRCPIEHSYSKGTRHSQKKVLKIGLASIIVIIVGLTVYEKYDDLVGSVSPIITKSDNNINTVTTTVTKVVRIAVPSIKPASISFSNKVTSLLNTTVQTIQQATQSNPIIQPVYTKQELYSYTLQLINQDRAKNGLPPVNLDNNQAAQAQADDMLKQQQLSHWMSTGEKPYMSYTRFGGLGNVGQNVAFDGYADIQQCISLDVICNMIDVKQSTSKLENDMMYNDQASNWGHRDNILDKHHTDVSIGISYDKYSFYIVQNFEDNYIDYTSPISENNGIVSFTGNLKSGLLNGIEIYYDPLPTSSLYELHKDDTSYGMGNEVAYVQSPPQGNSFYPPGTDTFEVANNWTQQGNNVDVSFDLSPFVTKAGVYTISVFLQDASGDSFPVTSYSILKNSAMVQEGFKSPNVYYPCTSDQLTSYNQLQQEANSVNQQIDSMKTQVDSIPSTVPEPQYSIDEALVSKYNNLVNQFNSIENQIQNYRC